MRRLRKNILFLILCFYISVLTVPVEAVEKKKVQQGVYSLDINRENKRTIYRPLKIDGEYYLPIFSFFNRLNFNNYEVDYNNKTMKIYLGINNEEIILNIDKNTVTKRKKTKVLEKDAFYRYNGELYLKEDSFKDIFLRDLHWDPDNLVLNVKTSFMTPAEIEFELEMNKEDLRLLQGKQINKFITEGSLIDFGNLRLVAETGYGNIGNTDKKSTSDWSGFLEYKMPFLYGVLSTSYDMKDGKLGDTSLYYTDIWNDHSLELGELGDGIGFELKRKRGYEKEGDQYIIREKVPMGSTVELYYRGVLIESGTAENSEIIFENSEIKRDRNFTLKIYTPDNKIEERIINIKEDNYIQNRGELEYDIKYLRNDTSNKDDFLGKVYYGFTDNFTVAVGLEQEHEGTPSGYDKVYTGNLETIYSNIAFNNNYSLKWNQFENLTTGEDGKGINYDERRRDEFYGSVDLGSSLRLTGEYNQQGKHYSEKSMKHLGIRYDLTESIKLDTYLEKIEYHEGDREHDYGVDISYTENVFNSLVTTNYTRKKDDKADYGLNWYYSGFSMFHIKAGVNWENNATEYSVSLNLDSKRDLFNKIEYGMILDYSNKDESTLGFSFKIEYDRWLDIFGESRKGGLYRSGVRIDKVVSIKDPMEKVHSIDSSTINIIAFLDEDGSGKYKESSKRISNIEVKLAGKTETTDRSGEATIYGLRNTIEYKLGVNVKHPMYSYGNQRILVEAEEISTIDVYIPIKPFITFTGEIRTDKIILDAYIDRSEFYSNIIVKIIDEDGAEVGATIPDEDGKFFINGLFSESYRVEIEYYGKKHEIATLVEEVNLVFNPKKKSSKFVFNL